jgi:hypothetical protein
VRIGRQLYLSELIIRRTCGNNKELVSASGIANQLKYSINKVGRLKTAKRRIAWQLLAKTVQF